jgi:peptide chain release factor 1
MFKNLNGVEDRFQEVENLLGDPEIIKDQTTYQKLVREHADLNRIVTVYRDYKKIQADIVENQTLMDDGDADIKELAREELSELRRRESEIEADLRRRLLPKDPNDEKNVVLEIRAGTGGEEAALFAADLYRMYSRYAESRNWKVEVLTHHPTGVGGLKEIIAIVQGKGAYSALKYESGTHRVQRVPTTETQGRIHTSAVTVAVLAEAEEVEVDIDPADLKVDVFRSSGPGGQSVNTTDSAVRITHLPSGLVVTCQDEKSQHKNKNKALKVLRARLLDRMVSQQDQERSQQRKHQVGSGDRSERIRTYNFPQGRVTDHRVGLTLYRLEGILQGDLQEIVQELTTHYQTQALQNVELDSVAQ